MKAHIIPALCVGLILLLCSCGAGSNTPVQPETGGEPLNITVFSFDHTGSAADECFSLRLTREDGGTHLYAEERFSGGRVVDTVIDNSALEQLETLAGTYGVASWDGFDKTSRKVADGSGFSLNLTLADGGTVSARGYHRFPENYAEVFSAVKTMYTDFMEQYAPREEMPESGAVTDRQDPNALEGGNGS